MPGSQQLGRPLEPLVPDKLVGRQAGQGLQLPVELHPAHAYLLPEILHAEIRVVQVGVDDGFHPRQEGLVEGIGGDVAGAKELLVA